MDNIDKLSELPPIKAPIKVPIKRSNAFFISSTSIIASIILLVILFIISYNCYIYPMLHQNKLQLTQQLYNSYITNIKSKNINSEIFINLNDLIINININTMGNNLELTILFFRKNKIIYKINKLIHINDITINNQALNLDINYSDILIINYNYIYNRYNLIIKDDNIEFESRYKIICSHSPFICNTSSFQIFRKLLIDNTYNYDNIFGNNEYSKIIFKKKTKIYKSGHLLNYLNKSFIDNFLLLSINNSDWILYFILHKIDDKIYNSYFIIKNIENDNIVYCGFLNKKLKFFHSVNIELNIGASIDELKFKFYSETLCIDFNTNNINNTYINENKSVKSIDLNINYNNELYKSNDKVFLLSNNQLSKYENLLLSI